MALGCVPGTENAGKSMPASLTQPRPKSWLWGSLTSIRLTVSLLLILAAVAVVGTLVPQQEAPELYLRQYGETLGGLLWRIGWGNLYYSFWFLAPISLLALNILACVVHGLPRAIRRSARPFNAEAALTLPSRGKLTWPAGVDPRPRVVATLRRELGRPRQETLAAQELYLYARGRWRPLGPYLVHLALLLILAGGLIGKFWGLEGTLPLLKGEEAQAMQVGQETIMPLDFQVRLDDFQVQFYAPGGAPEEFRSDLSFLKDGKVVARATCRVNEPVSFGGFTFYQASYGSEPTGPIRLKVSHDGREQTLEAALRRLTDLPGGDGIMPVKVDGNLEGYGPAVQLALKSGSGHPQIFWVVQGHPELSEQSGPYRFTLESVPFQFYSVFQVKRDPGVRWVYAGFILFLPGFYLAFFRPTQRWAVVLEQTPKGAWRAQLLGASPRNREEFAACQERLLAGFKGGTPS